MAQHAAGADEQVDLAQVLAAALDDPAVGADDDLAAAGVPAQGEPDRGAGDAPRRRRARRRSPGRNAGSARRTLRRRAAVGVVEQPGRARLDGGTAHQRMPRSPSTVRVTGVVATTSRASAGVLGVELDHGVHVGGGAADVDDHHVAGARVLGVEAAGQQLDAGQHDVGRRAAAPSR